MLVDYIEPEAKEMKIAIPVWNDRVSTVFEAAEELMIIENKPGTSPVKSRAACLHNSMIGRTMQLKILNVDVLICGALTRPMKHRIESTGIRVISFVRGVADDVFEAFCKGELANQQFMLPGCRPDRNFEKRRCRRRGRQTVTKNE